MKKYLVYIAACSFDRTVPMYDRKQVKLNLAYKNVVLADTRIGAIKKCMPDITKLISQITDPTIKYVSVYAGLRYGSTNNAERLSPIQIDVTTKNFRLKI